MMGIGLLCLVLSYIFEPAAIAEAGVHQRFWSNFLLNASYFTGMAFMIAFVIAAFTLAYSGWFIVFKRLWEPFALFLVPGLVLMLVLAIGNYAHLHHLYHWAADGVTDINSEHYDAVLAGKSLFLNKGWYLFGTLVLGGIWAFCAVKFRQTSIAEDNDGAHPEKNFPYQAQLRKWSAVLLPIAAFTGPVMIWQWIMSVDAHWYSTLYAWYCMAGWWLAACSLSIILLIYLKGKGYFEQVTIEHLHDLAKYMFAFSIFWTYCWFSQYMLIWFANVGEETIYFRERLDHYSALFYGNLVINFVLPFLILMRNTTKRRNGTLIFASLIVFLGHWMDFFYLIKPGTLITAKEIAEGGGHHGAEGAHHAAAHASTFVEGFTIPGLIDIGVMIGFLGFFLYFVFQQLTKASLIPENDPYLQESLHHEVQVYE